MQLSYHHSVYDKKQAIQPILQITYLIQLCKNIH